MEHKKLSMLDIAQMANVSIATVSRVLNKNGRYSVETEKRVMRIVNENDYMPNMSAKSLRTNKSQSIAVMVPDITNEFFAKIVRSVENTILPYNYSVFVCDFHENEEIEDLHIANVATQNVDGVIYIAGRVDVRGVDKKLHIPIVYIDRQAEHANIVVQSDNEYGGFLATEELLKKGCRRIFFLCDRRRLLPIRQRYEGYLKAHKKYGVPIDDTLKLDGTVGYVQAKEDMLRILEEGKLKFDGVFATNDTMALGVLHAMQEFGTKVPDEVKLVGFDDISLSEFCNPPLTTITQNTEMMGQKAVIKLIEMMKGDKTVCAQNIVIPVTLDVRGTT